MARLYMDENRDQDATSVAKCCRAQAALARIILVEMPQLIFALTPYIASLQRFTGNQGKELA